ncbi:hypothetical protein BDZ85DRAFT_3590 [Elsinoe ampelina]|uniref:Protein kinase domain-containing protein n=1 Tax=Elsinoe ampelina TaxID=302913 RepID=A0A6A6GP28_9PEZI|nr:hypothetical protein BDZ85DRAFT_3590 [Elsinoe ampelina]
MISSADRLIQISGSGCQPGRGFDLVDYQLVDADQRRVYTVYGRLPQGHFDPDMGSSFNKIRHLLQSKIDELPPTASTVEISPEYDILSAGGEPPLQMDPSPDPYPRLAGFPSLAAAHTIRWDHLIEEERLDQQIDLCSYYTRTQGRKQVIFKYSAVPDWFGWLWRELVLYVQLPKHPFTVPFDRIVTDESGHRILGLTIAYVKGGTLRDSPPTIFKLKYLHQLTSVIDDLNLKYGVHHSDIHPGNILFDKATESIQLIDFGFSSRITSDRPELADRADTKGVAFTIYEILTGDYSHRDAVCEWPEIDIVVNMKEWQLRDGIKLDASVDEFRLQLTNWLEYRADLSPIGHYTACPEHVADELPLPRRPNKWSISPVTGIYDDEYDWEHRRISWQRLPEYKLVHDVIYLANGKALEGELPCVDD